MSPIETGVLFFVVLWIVGLILALVGRYEGPVGFFGVAIMVWSTFTLAVYGIQLAFGWY